MRGHVIPAAPRDADGDVTRYGVGLDLGSAVGQVKGDVPADRVEPDLAQAAGLHGQSAGDRVSLEVTVQCMALDLARDSVGVDVADDVDEGQ